MAKPISEVIAENSEVLKAVKGLVVKAEEKPAEQPATTENKEGEEGEPTGEETVTKEMYDALCERLDKLEEALKASEEDKDKLTEVVEETTEALNRVNAFFKQPSNRAQLSTGEAPKAKVEAVEAPTEKNALETWMAMPTGKASQEFYALHEKEILELMAK